MVVCVFAVVMPSDNVDAVPSGDDRIDVSSNITIDTENASTYEGGFDVTGSSPITVTINTDLIITTTTNYAIYSATSLTINGTGSLTINVTHAEESENDSLQTWGIYSAGTLTLNVETTVLANVSGSDGNYTADGNQTVGVQGTSVTINANADIFAGNRAVYSSGTITIGADAAVTAGAYEKGIRGTTTSSNLVVNGTLNATILEDDAGNNVQGTNDRFGVKTGYVTVTGTLNTDGMRIYGSNASTVSGTLNINYISYGGSAANTSTTAPMAAIPAGLVMIQSSYGSSLTIEMSEIQITGSGEINVDSGNAIVGKITGKASASETSKTDGSAVFGSAVASSTSGTVSGGDVESITIGVNGATFTAGCLNIDGEFTGDEESGFTITGEATLSGTIGENVHVTILNGGIATVPAGDSLVNNGSITGGTGSEFYVEGTYSGEPATGSFNSYAVRHWDADATATRGTTYFYFGSDYSGEFVLDEGDAISLGNQAQGDVSVTVTTANGTEILLTTENDRVSYMQSGGNNNYATGVSVTGSPVTSGVTDNNITVITNSTATIVSLGDDAMVYGTVALSDMTLENTITTSASANVVLPYGTTLEFGDSPSIPAEGANEAVDEYILLGESGSAGNMYVFGDLRADDDANKIDNTNGIVYALDVDDVAYYVTNPDNGATSPVHLIAISSDDARVKIYVDDNASALSDLNDLIPGTSVLLTSNNANTTSPVNKVLNITGTLNLENIDFLIDEGINLTINIGTGTGTGQRATVTFVDVILDRVSTESMIKVSSGSSFDVTDSMLYIIVSKDQGASVDVNNAGVVYENTSSNVRVGYGTDLSLTGNVTSVVDVYGNLIIESTASVPARTTMTVYNGGSLTVNGTLTILGNAEFEAGSTVTVNGDVIVGNTNGGATLTVNGNMTVESEGTLTISSVQSGNRNVNRLIAPTDTYVENTVYTDDYQHKLSVYGTLAMNGAMSGFIHDYGTVTINGSAITSTTPNVVLYPGVSITVDSFSGTLNIIDQGAADSLITGSNIRISDGNTVTIENARGITVSVATESVNWRDSTGTNHRDYITVMTVSGEISNTGTNGTITIDSDDSVANGVGSDRTDYAYVTLGADDSMSFGINVSVNVAGTFVVDGTIDFAMSATVNGVEDEKTFSGTGEMTVNGTVTLTNVDITGNPDINAVKYTVVTTGTDASTINTYTNFVAAIEAAPNAEQDTVNVMGDVSVSQDVPVSAGITIQMNRNSELTVEEGATVTLADGATLTGSGATVSVDGTLISQDYATDVARTLTISSDVVRTEDAVRTWTSLAGALDLGWTDITLNRPIVIDSDVTIPEGTTVTTNIAPGSDEFNGTNYDYSILVYGATLTVEGSLQMGSNAEGALVVIDNTDGSEGEIAVPGNLQITVLTPSDVNDNQYLRQIAGAHFQTMDGAYTIQHIGSIAYAAETTANNTAVTDDGITIYGGVSAEDATFDAADNDTLTISIAPGEANRLSMGTMALSGDVVFYIGGTFTGTIEAPVADGSANTVIEMDGTTGITIVADHETGATETTYTVSAYGTFAGSVTVSEGTLTAGAVTGTTATTTLSIDSESTMIVSSGATVSIPTGMTLYASSNTRTVTLTVDGTINIVGTLSYADMEVHVTGTMNINNDMIISNSIRVCGTINVADREVLIIDGVLVLGDKPSQLGASTTGSISGEVDIRNGGIIAYNGTDLSEADINLNSATGSSMAKVTTYVINGTNYATIYVFGDEIIAEAIGTYDGSIDLSGWETPSNTYDNAGNLVSYANVWYSTENFNTRVDTPVGNYSIGDYATVYAEFSPENIVGNVSKDAGIILTIDDMVVGTDLSATIEYPLSVGTHTISWSERTGYNIDNVTVTFNGQAVENGGTITITADMTGYTIIAQGAVPGAAPGGDTGSTGGDDRMGLTDYLLIVLVILIVVMAIIVALRLMRS